MEKGKNLETDDYDVGDQCCDVKCPGGANPGLGVREGFLEEVT